MTRGGDDSSRRGTRAGIRTVLSLVGAMLAVAGCGSPAIVNTGEPWTPIETAAPPPRLPQHTTNLRLADASEFYITQSDVAESGTRKAYRFATPSGRWHCVIVPHASAGCQPATSSQLSITGAPTAVPGADGEPTAPNTIIIDQVSDVRFVYTASKNDPDSPGPVTTLPFGKVLMVAGFRCNVQEVTGVSCGSEASGKGFTFSSDGYTGVYTDVPQ